MDRLYLRNNKLRGWSLGHGTPKKKTPKEENLRLPVSWQPFLSHKIFESIITNTAC